MAALWRIRSGTSTRAHQASKRSVAFTRLALLGCRPAFGGLGPGSWTHKTLDPEDLRTDIPWS